MSLTRKSFNRCRPLIEQCESRALLTTASLAALAPAHQLVAHVDADTQTRTSIHNYVNKSIEFTLTITNGPFVGGKILYRQKRTIGQRLGPDKPSIRPEDWKKAENPTFTISFVSYRTAGKPYTADVTVSASDTPPIPVWKFTASGTGVNEVITLSQ